MAYIDYVYAVPNPKSYLCVRLSSEIHTTHSHSPYPLRKHLTLRFCSGPSFRSVQVLSRHTFVILFLVPIIFSSYLLHDHPAASAPILFSFFLNTLSSGSMTEALKSVSRALSTYSPMSWPKQVQFRPSSTARSRSEERR